MYSYWLASGQWPRAVSLPAFTITCQAENQAPASCVVCLENWIYVGKCRPFIVYTLIALYSLQGLCVGVRYRICCGVSTLPCSTGLSGLILHSPLLYKSLSDKKSCNNLFVPFTDHSSVPYWNSKPMPWKGGHLVLSCDAFSLSLLKTILCVFCSLMY